MISFAVPGDLTLPTGGYAFARRTLTEWQEAAIASEVISLPGSFPFPTDAALRETREALLGEGPFLIDGLAYGAFPEDLAKVVGPKSVALVHHPLCDEQGLDRETAAELERTERAALRHAAGVVATSPMTGRDLMRRFGVTEAVIAVPGTDPAPLATMLGDPPRILSVGTVTPRKGYRLLIEALSACRDLDWICEIVGADDRDDGEAARVRAAILGTGLEDRVIIRGAIDDVECAYLGADLFVSSSLHEGYGMAVVEAMTHGLPVVTTTAGALAETAPVARLVAPSDAGALADALRPLIADAEARQKLGADCLAFAKDLPGWSDTAQIIADAVEKIR